MRKTKIVKGIVTFKGEKFHIRDLAKKHRISVSNIYARARKGWGIEEILTIPVGFVYDNSQRRMVDKHGINIGTFRSRLKRGVPEKQALTAPPGSLERKKWTRSKPIQDKQTLYSNIFEFKDWENHLHRAIYRVQSMRVNRALKR